MKSPIFLIIALLFGAFAPRPDQQTDQAVELDKATQLSAEVTKLFGEARYQDALPIAQQVLEVRQRLLKPDDEQLAIALSNLGEIYHALKKEPEATKAFQGALAIYETHPNQNVLMLAKTLERLGYAFYMKRDFKSAEPLYLRAVELEEKALGPRDAQTILAMKNYACIDFLADAGQWRGKDSTINPDDPVKALRNRATCWLSGFKEDCSDSVGQGARAGVLNGKAVHLATPRYPEVARNQRRSGVSFIVVLIDESGKVIQSRAVCGGYDELNEASLQAARASVFTPTTMNGQPVKVTGAIIYNFVAQ